MGITVDGQPFVIPMAFGRDGDRLVLHGSVASRLLRTLGEGAAVCVTVTLIDAVVLARSQFHTSMDYRSVVIVGTATLDPRPRRQAPAMECLVEHVVPGRSREARPPTDAELRQIAVVEIPIETASVKARTDGAVDEPDDLELDVVGRSRAGDDAYGTPVQDGQADAPMPDGRPSAALIGSPPGRRVAAGDDSRCRAGHAPFGAGGPHRYWPVVTRSI